MYGSFAELFASFEMRSYLCNYCVMNKPISYLRGTNFRNCFENVYCLLFEKKYLNKKKRNYKYFNTKICIGSRYNRITKLNLFKSAIIKKKDFIM